MIKLYDYQESGVSEIRSAYSSGLRSVLYCLPTGGGKTVVFSYIAMSAVNRGNKVLIITDRQELLNGSAKSLLSCGLHPHLVRSGSRDNISKSVYVGMSQTLKRRLSRNDYALWFKNHFDLVIIDECHKEEFNYFFENGCFDNCKVLGVTATPKRIGSQRQLAMDYQRIVMGPSVQDLISKGYLSVPVYHYSEELRDYSSVRLSRLGGELDFNSHDIAAFNNIDKVGANMIEQWEALCKGMVTIVFCSGSANTIKACKLFNDRGYSAKYLISDTKEKEAAQLHSEYKNVYSGERRKLIQDWKHGRFNIMVNNGILTTGFDFPAIRCVILNRSTMSTNLFLQMCGRGSRVMPGKDSFHIIDMSDNIARLNKWHIPRAYSLAHKKGGSGEAPTKTCPCCGQVVFASVMRCNMFDMKKGSICNYVFKSPERICVEITLNTVAYEDLEYSFIISSLPNLSVQELCRIADAKGWRRGWVYHRLREAGRELEFKNI